jgi:hypothetical protein
MVGANEMLTSRYSAGEIMSDISLLSPERRSTVVDFILFLKSCEQIEEKEKKVRSLADPIFQGQSAVIRCCLHSCFPIFPLRF